MASSSATQQLKFKTNNTEGIVENVALFCYCITSAYNCWENHNHNLFSPYSSYSNHHTRGRVLYTSS